LSVSSGHGEEGIIMRKTLWIVLVLLLLLFAAIVVPNANADSSPDATTITDLGLTRGTLIPTLDDPEYTFTCCNGGKPPMTDLSIEWSAVISSISSRPFGL
jgi:hypothetical protein